MVDAFSQYARSPEPDLQPLDLNQLVREVLGLYESSRPALQLELGCRPAAGIRAMRQSCGK